MSDSKASTPPREEEKGVLANLPRTRPQRSSARRTAARETTAAQASGAGAPGARRARSAGARPKSTAAKPQAAKRARGGAKRARASSAPRDPSPRQGFESDGETMSGTVPPPGGAELVASAAELLGELAKASVSSGERLLKDVFSRLRPS